MTKAWVIKGYDSLKETFAEFVPEGNATADQIVVLLKCLASRHLEDREVFSGFVGTTSLLDVRQDHGASNPTFMTGGNPHYIASLREVD